MFHWPVPIAPWSHLPPVVRCAPVTVWPNPCLQPFLECNPVRAPGTGILPGVITPVQYGGRHRRIWPKHDEFLEAWRAWQRKTGCTPNAQQPIPGHKPPNLFVCPTPSMMGWSW